jgi:cytosine/adenosine deaminase-related metal-dependent hydrolase
MILTARALLIDAQTLIEGGALWVERGRVRRVLRSRAAARRFSRRATIDLGDALLTPGLVDAHAHLELGALAGRLGGSRGFVSWIQALIRARARLTPRDLELGVRRGARVLLAGGTTTVGDIDSSGATGRLARGLGLRVVVYRELLDAWDPARTAVSLARVRRPIRSNALAREGLAPHAPYTTSRELLREAGRIAARRRLPIAIHWAETSAEGEWLATSRGPFAKILPSGPRTSGLDLLAEAGLLTPRTALIHGNHPQSGEPAHLARQGVTIVHCPGTHAFFAREPFPVRRYLAAGVPVALGTDSLASNEALDMRREMALFRRSFPALSPRVAFQGSTEHAARALGRDDLGHLRPGAAADVAAFRVSARGAARALDELSSAIPEVQAVFVAGQPVRESRFRPRFGRESAVH